jgi:hypothetical protein
MVRRPALPLTGDVLFDRRGNGRTLRVQWHPELQAAVLSVWWGGRCAATIQVDRHEVPALIGSLSDGLALVPPPDWSAATLHVRPDSGWRARVMSVLRRSSGG